MHRGEKNLSSFHSFLLSSFLPSFSPSCLTLFSRRLFLTDHNFHPQSYCIHTDSVWCLAPSHDFSQVYSGGRDGYVFVTQLKGSHTPHHPHPNPHASTSSSLSYLVAKESKPIRCLALEAFPPATGAGGGGGGKSEAELKVWVGTESSHIHQYASPSTSTSISSSTLASTPARSNQPSPSPSPLDPNKNIQIRIETTTIPPPTFRRKSSMNGTPVKQLGDQAGPKPVWTIPGLPAIVKQKVQSLSQPLPLFFSLYFHFIDPLYKWSLPSGRVVERIYHQCIPRMLSPWPTADILPDPLPLTLPTI